MAFTAKPLSAAYALLDAGGYSRSIARRSGWSGAETGAAARAAGPRAAFARCLELELVEKVVTHCWRSARSYSAMLMMVLAQLSWRWSLLSTSVRAD
ncbi:hypothetical protein [Streptomyces sp. NPDC056669]|uniref:hypothetical protein n=1 Tax=Streptomyces sp. NPDC056669 TaxID=3345903 RepID=UPI0036B0C1C9